MLVFCVLSTPWIMVILVASVLAKANPACAYVNVVLPESYAACATVPALFALP